MENQTLFGDVVDLYKDQTYRGFFALSNNVEHYTPRAIWEPAIKVMGGIDCDPASDINKNVPAGTHYTIKENGLLQPWIGRIWLNPPFGRDVWRWFDKLRGEYLSGNTREAIILWKTASETRGWRILTEISDTICLPYRRIFFINKHFKGEGSTFSPALLYVGKNRAAFVREYEKIGAIWFQKSVLTTSNEMSG